MSYVRPAPHSSHVSWRRQAQFAFLVVFLLAALPAWRAGAASYLHRKGSTTLSLGGSVSRTDYYDRNYASAQVDLVEEYPWLTEEDLAGQQQEESKAETYAATELSVYLSGGYFLVDGFELGLTGSTMLTWYHGGSQSDLEIYDTELYGKYYFDNSTSVTPYLSLRGGASWLDIGTYSERNMTGGFSAGLEFGGSLNHTWYIEYSSQYKFNDGDLSGEEWRNRIYIGITWYFNFFEKKD